MKKVVLFLVLISLFSFEAYSQRYTKSQYRNVTSLTLSLGVNSVGSLGTRNALENLGDFSFSQPFAISIQYRGWSDIFSLEQDFTLNKFKKNAIIDNAPIPKDFTYFSTNTYAKYYFSDRLFPDTYWLDLYAGAGLGIFKIDKVNGSFNLVIGGIAWVTPSIGLSLQGVGKFAFNHKNAGTESNHFQYMFYTVFKL